MAEIDLKIMTEEEQKEYRHKLEAERDKIQKELNNIYREKNREQLFNNMKLVGKCFKKEINVHNKIKYRYSQVVSVLSNNIYRVSTIEFNLPISKARLVQPRCLDYSEYENYILKIAEIDNEDPMVRELKLQIEQGEIEEITQEEFYKAFKDFHIQMEENLKEFVTEEQKREI